MEGTAMSDDLNFGDQSWNQAKGTVFTELINLHEAIDGGDGKPGVKQEIVGINTRLSKMEVTTEVSLKWIKAIAAALALIISAATFYISTLEVRHRVPPGFVTHAAGSPSQSAAKTTTPEIP
jgi:hypothetical protein